MLSWVQILFLVSNFSRYFFTPPCFPECKWDSSKWNELNIIINSVSADNVIHSYPNCYLTSSSGQGSKNNEIWSGCKAISGNWTQPVKDCTESSKNVSNFTLHFWHVRIFSSTINLLEFRVNQNRVLIDAVFVSGLRKYSFHFTDLPLIPFPFMSVIHPIQTVWVRIIPFVPFGVYRVSSLSTI